MTLNHSENKFFLDKKIFTLDEKITLISFRFVILLFILFFILYGPYHDLKWNGDEFPLLRWTLIFPGIYLGTNLLFFFLPNLITKKSVLAGTFTLDTAIITFVIYKIQGFESDLFLVYFLVVFMTVISHKSIFSFLAGGIACLLYALIYLKTSSTGQLLQPFVLIRFPILLVGSFFSSIIVHESEKNKMNAIQTLSEMSQAIFSKLELDSLLPSLVGLSIHLFKADDVSIMLMGEDGKLFIAASHHLKDVQIRNVRLEIGEKVAGKIAEWKKGALIVGSLDKDPRFKGLKSNHEINSSMIYPLLSEKKLLGVLCVNRTKNKIHFNPEDLQNANVFVTLVSQAIENAQLYKDLETKIDNLNRAQEKLTQMQQELIQSEKLAGIGKLAAGVAHELNNPLTSILALLDLLISEGKHSTQELEDLKTLKTQSLMCSRIVSNLLQFSRKNKLQKEITSLNQIVIQSMSRMERELKNSNISVVLNLDPNNPTIEADPFQMEQVVLNILRNSEDALNRKPMPKIMVRTTSENGHASLVIEDNGCGIPKQWIDKIFDPFFTTKEVGKGTGLGLSISYGIIQEHGGSIQVSSQERVGTQFKITLDCLQRRKELIASSMQG